MSCRICGSDESQCRGAFRRQAIHTVHWECWSDCNLQCDFCYRSIRSPLDTPDALALIEAISYAGAARLILAGGDPSLRRDLNLICHRAVDCGLSCEIQTNGQRLTPALESSLPYANRLYLSLDGPSAAVHDAFRSKRGNFAGVGNLLTYAEDHGLPVTVHSVASRRNWKELPALIPYLLEFPCVDTWSVLEFSPIGAGYHARRNHEMSPSEWRQLVKMLEVEVPSRLRVAVLAGEQKSALYAMISADGYAYRAAEPTSNGTADQARIGSVLDMHLADIAAGWRIDPDRHTDRYVNSS